jgi:hypothetical protein
VLVEEAPLEEDVPEEPVPRLVVCDWLPDAVVEALLWLVFCDGPQAPKRAAAAAATSDRGAPRYREPDA